VSLTNRDNKLIILCFRHYRYLFPGVVDESRLPIYFPSVGADFLCIYFLVSLTNRDILHRTKVSQRQQYLFPGVVDESRQLAGSQIEELRPEYLFPGVVDESRLYIVVPPLFNILFCIYFLVSLTNRDSGSVCRGDQVWWRIYFLVSLTNRDLLRGVKWCKVIWLLYLFPGVVDESRQRGNGASMFFP